jgi:superfamily II DNA or RNA helicase
MFEYDYVMNYAPRNNVIAKIAKKLNGNTLIVVDRLQYISSIHDCLKNCGKKIYIITGNTPTDERTVIQNTMDAEDNIICIAMSKCFSTGISIKNLHYAIFAYMGKGGVKTVQTIGRTVRKHSSKEKAVIFDISDDLNYSVRHLKERLKIYKDQKITYTLTKIKI